jgi:transposase-like protein
MRPYSEAVKADVRRRMIPPMRQSVAQISAELGIHVVTHYNWRKAWRLQGEVVTASEKDPEGWSAADKFTVVLETAGLNAMELSAYCWDGVCTRSRWSGGGKHPRMPTKSQCSH